MCAQKGTASLPQKGPGTTETTERKDAKAADTAPEADDALTLEVASGDPRYDQFKVSRAVRASDAKQFRFEPTHFGPKVMFLNAQEQDFYKREHTSPKLSIWVLCRDEKMNGYVKKRLYEAAWEKNCNLQIKGTSHFELFASKDGLDKIFYGVGQLDQMGVLLLNSYESINISRDKLYTLQHVAAHGIMIPQTMVVKFPVNIAALDEAFQYPLILKKCSGSQGKGVMKVEKKEQLEDVVDMLDYQDPLIFQEYIQASAGRDLRVLVIGGRVIASMMRTATKGFKANVHQGGSVKAVQLQPQVEWLVLETVRLIGLDIAGVDLLIDKNTYKICEVNSSPGFHGLERATGVDVASATIEYAKFRAGVWRVGAKRQKKMLDIPVQAEHRE